MMSVQLVGTTKVGLVILLPSAFGMPALVDVALVLALLAAVAVAALTGRGSRERPAMAEWPAGVLIVTGLAFFVAGSVGLLRLPDL